MGNHKLGSSLTNVGFESIKSIIESGVAPINSTLNAVQRGEKKETCRFATVNF